MPTPVSKNNGQIPTSLASPGAVRFWLAVCLIGASTGLAAAALTRLLEVVQRLHLRFRVLDGDCLGSFSARRGMDPAQTYSKLHARPARLDTSPFCSLPAF